MGATHSMPIQKKELTIQRIGLVSFGMLLLAFMAAFNFLGSQKAGAVSSSILNYLKANIIDDESQCTSALSAQRSTYQYQNSSKPKYKSARNMISDSNPYKDELWISEQGAPSSPIKARVGDSSLKLQLNDLEFICSVLTHNNNSTYPNAPYSATSTRVLSNQWANDRDVYGDADGGVHAASRYQFRTRIESACIVTPTGCKTNAGAYGSLSGVDVGTVLLNSRVGTGASSPTRYWLSNQLEYFTYVPAGGTFTEPVDVTIRFNVKYLETYHDVLGGGSDVNTCKGTGGTPGTSISSASKIPWGMCPIDTITRKFHVDVDKPSLTVNVSPTCSLSGTAYDSNYPNNKIQIDVYRGATKVGTTYTDPKSHAYSFALGTASDWADYNYTVYARGPGADGDAQKTTLVRHCGSLTCTGASSTFNAVSGTPQPFTVNIKVLNAKTNPPGNPQFKVWVQELAPTARTFSPTMFANDNAISGGKISSATLPTNPLSFTAPEAGMYQVNWQYYNSPTCHKSDKAGYTPFFNVQGGDIAAGVGFTEGTGCDQSASADIIGWNKGSNTYAGAGSYLGALATGNITDFVSGMGLSGGAATQSGHALSFTNTTNIAAGGYGGQFVDASGNGVTPCLPDYYGNHSDGDPYAGTALNQADIDPYAGTAQALSANDDGSDPNYLLTIGSSGSVSIPAGTTITMYVRGNVYIQNNIVYSPYTLDSVPRFNLYVSGNVYVNQGVTEIHGVYVTQVDPDAANPGTTGIFTTCAHDATSTSEQYATCNTRLKVVGAVASETELRMSRTHGTLTTTPDARVAGGVVPAEPAELFEYSPELWLSAPTSGTIGAQTYTSLPPVL